MSGIKKGHGIYTFGNGDVFDGEYDNNVRNGNGELKKADGEERFVKSTYFMTNVPKN